MKSDIDMLYPKVGPRVASRSVLVPSLHGYEFPTVTQAKDVETYPDDLKRIYCLAQCISMGASSKDGGLARQELDGTCAREGRARGPWVDWLRRKEAERRAKTEASGALGLTQVTSLPFSYTKYSRPDLHEMASQSLQCVLSGLGNLKLI